MTYITAGTVYDAGPKRVLKDGEGVRIPFAMMDAALRDQVVSNGETIRAPFMISDAALADAEIQRRANDAAEGARDAAKAIYDRRVSTGWMNDGAKATFEDEQRSISDGDGAHVTYVKRIADAWKATR